MNTELRLYAIVRADLKMPAGKLAAQAGHAYLESFLTANSDLQIDYRKDGIGTKITLQARDLKSLFRIHYQCSKKGIPCALIEDSGHIMPPYFDGSPIITAIGVGPCTRETVSQITDSFQLL